MVKEGPRAVDQMREGRKRYLRKAKQLRVLRVGSVEHVNVSERVHRAPSRSRDNSWAAGTVATILTVPHGKQEHRIHPNQKGWIGVLFENATGNHRKATKPI